MRKRIVIGLLAAAVIGMVAFWPLRPENLAPTAGTVEWHQREFERHRTEYLEARDQNTWSDRLKRRYYNKVTGRWPPPQTTAEFHAGLNAMQRNLENMRRHQDALAQLGYVIERRFTGIEVMFSRWEDKPKWEQAVPKADVP